MQVPLCTSPSGDRHHVPHAPLSAWCEPDTHPLPIKKRVSFPLPEAGPANGSLVTKRMQHKGLCVTSEALSEETIQLPPGSLGELGLGDIQPLVAITQALRWTVRRAPPARYPTKGLDI